MPAPLFANSSPPATGTNHHDDDGTISIASTWRSVRTESSTVHVQTVPIVLSSSGCGPDPLISVECQTIGDAGSVVRLSGSAAAARSAEPTSMMSWSRGKLFDVAELAAFVQRVEGPLSEMLMENLQSSAFDDWPLVNPLVEDDDDAAASVDNLLTLTDTLVHDAQSNSSSSTGTLSSALSLIAADRSKSGSSLILAYAHPHRPHDTQDAESAASPWCTHSAAHVAVILNGQQQRLAHWQLNACPTTLAVHPEQTNLVAAGTWPGDVLVWDSNVSLASMDGTSAVAAVASVPANIAHWGHADAVAQIVWVPSSATSTNSLMVTGLPSGGSSAKGILGGLWSAGTDGSVIEWRYIPASSTATAMLSASTVARLEPVRRCTVGVPMTRSPSTSVGGLGMPLRSLAIHADVMVGTTMALVGSDAGHVVHLDARRIRPLADSAPGVPADSLNASATLTNPHFKYASHAGAVNAIVANPHLPSLFATLGQDGKVLIHRLFKDMPLLRIQPAALSSSSPNPTPLLSGAWSPSRPGLLAVTSTDTLYLISICGSDPGTVVAQLSLPCTGPLLFHPTLPLLYVGVIENGASGMRVVRLAASALKLGDMEVRVKEMTELGRMIGGDNNDE